MPPDIGGALIKDKAQKWIALTPIAVYCGRNIYYVYSMVQQCVKSPQKRE